MLTRLCLLAGCHPPKTSTQSPTVENFGKLSDGREAKLYTLGNQKKMTAKVTDFGATLVALSAPDREGKTADLTLGFDTVEGYASEANPCFGATAGRFGNRIAGGRFTLDDKTYELATNNAPGGIPCHLHGGNVGFNKRMWSVVQATSSSVTFEYISADGEEGYPGTLTTRVTYTVTEDNELIWDVTATTDAPTVVNIIHHSYWNLSNQPGSSAKDHILELHADRYLPTDAGLIPTGEPAPVAGTPMDFTQPARVGERITDDFDALKLAGGYDHCWLLNQPDCQGLAPVARLREPGSGRVMELFSNQPAVQFYAGNFLDENVSGKNGVRYGPQSGLCLETENFPDAPNQPASPSPILRPGETYRHRMVHRFSAE
ncbi:galactose-1-epimerase [Coraliomargarita sinensis]|uniref:Aldose 1-epimerase n=1 Tax=Coraliomargarita sinensis TaxID=2174842 RepID=A0A317ZGY5_9BACT|nr:aldose epimerase family protein [Coraliomargarita sinensis]PXA03039.1 galactose-1-epimerase [Coraliomargarita sinensis]